MVSTHNAATAQILNSYNNTNTGVMSTLTPNANAVPTNTTVTPRINEFEDNMMTATFGMHLNEEALNPFNDVPFDNPFDDIPASGNPPARSPKGSASGQSGFNQAQSRSPKGSASGQAGFDQNQRRSPNTSVSGQSNPAQNTTSPRNILAGGYNQPNFNMNGASPRSNQQHNASPPKSGGGLAQNGQQTRSSASPPKNTGWGLSPRQQSDPLAAQPKSPRPVMQSHASQPKLGATMQPTNSLAPSSPRRGNSAMNLGNNNTASRPTAVLDSSAPLSRPALGAAGPKRAPTPVKRLDIATTGEQAAGGATSSGHTSPRGMPGPTSRDGSQYNPTSRPPQNVANGTPPQGFVKTSSPAPARSAAPSITSRSGEIGDLAVVVSALLSASAPPAVKTQYAVKLANYMSTGTCVTVKMLEYSLIILFYWQMAIMYVII